jgi:1,4-dihydroxy-2-naphthoyl-CoA synthase
MRTADAGCAAIFFATPATAASSSASGTTRFTRPRPSAVFASTISPVNSISNERLRPIARETATLGVEQNRPRLMPVVPKRAFSEAIARSQLATAAGAQLVASCDLAIASENARFGTTGINLGLFCSTPSVAISRSLGRKRSFEMLFTGEMADAKTAESIGLVNRVVPLAELDAAVASVAKKLAAQPPSAVRIGKEMFQRQLGMPLAEAYKFAGDTMAANMMEPDAIEGIDAFIAKRDPSWKR